jgi:hypothetical protein
VRRKPKARLATARNRLLSGAEERLRRRGNVGPRPAAGSGALPLAPPLVQRGVVIIPKSVRPKRMRENIDIFDFDLTAEQMARVATLDTGASLFVDHRDPATVT